MKVHRSERHGLYSVVYDCEICGWGGETEWGFKCHMKVEHEEEVERGVERIVEGKKRLVCVGEGGRRGVLEVKVGEEEEIWV